MGLAGAATVAGGVVLAAPAVLLLGGAVTAGAIVWCGVKAIPARARRAQDLVGTALNLSALETIHPPLRRIAFTGPSQGGKSTSVSHLQARAARPIRTDEPYASIIVIQASPPAYFVLVDGAGQQFSQQFVVVDAADDVIVCLDHNESDSSVEIDLERLKQHDRFLEQMLAHIRRTGKEPRRTHFLLNKRDLWEPEEGAAADILKWFHAHVEDWRKQTRGTVTRAIHSNRMSSDIVRLVEMIRSWAEE